MEQQKLGKSELSQEKRKGKPYQVRLKKLNQKTLNHLIKINFYLDDEMCRK